MNMNKIKFNVLRAIVLVFAIVGALAPMAAMAQTGDLFFGQEHSYTVVFRGNGEAVVYGKIGFTNTGDKAVDMFGIQIPNANPTEFTALQQTTVVNNNPCIYPYQYESYGKPCAMEDLAYPSGGFAENRVMNNPSGYEKLTFKSAGNQYDIKLTQVVEPNAKGEVIFAYVAKGYVNKSLGVYKFAFETPKVNSRIKNVSVSVDVDSELILKGKRSNVNYSTRAVSDGMTSAFADSSGARMSSPEFVQSVSLIGTNGPVTKTAQNLSPNESLTVNGEYANSKLALNWFSMLWKVLLGLVILVVIIWLIRWSYLRSSKITTASDSSQANAPLNTPHAEEETFHLLHPLYSAVGVLSAFVVVGIGFLSQMALRSTIMYGTYDSGITSLAIILLAGLFILVVLVLPPVLIGIKLGWRAGVSVLVNTLLAFVVLLALYIILRITGVWPMYSPAVRSYPDYPMMY